MGVSLVELAIVLVVIGLLVAWGTGMFGTLTKRNKLNTTRKRIELAKESLIGYAIKNNRLPCPDTYDDSNYDGEEDCPYSSSSPFKNTKLPYVTLGIKGEDAYLKQLYYDVNESLTSTTSEQDLCVALRVEPTWTESPQITQNEGTSWSTAAAVVLSTSVNMSLDPSVHTNTDDSTYELKAIKSNFDDIVEWIDVGTILHEKNCQGCTSYSLYNWAKDASCNIATIYVLGGVYTTCTQIPACDAFNVRLGDVVVAYRDSACTKFIMIGYSARSKVDSTVTYWRAQDLDRTNEGDGTEKNDCKVNAKYGVT